VAIQLGLIGLGPWGRIYLNTLADLNGVNVKRIASRQTDLARLLPADCIVSPDWHDVVQADDIDGVIIATPPSLHYEMTRRAVTNGLPVMVEKPLTTDLHEAESLLDLAVNRGGFVLVDHVHLYHPAYRKIKELLRVVGPVHSIESSGGNWGPFRLDTTVLWDWGPHDIALCIDLIGELPTNISVVQQERRHTDDGYGEIITLDLLFKDDVPAKITIGNIMPQKQRTFAVTFDNCILVYDELAASKLTLYPNPLDSTHALVDGKTIEIEPTPPLTCAVQTFINGITDKSRDTSSLQLGVHVVEVLARCDRGLDSHRQK